MIKMDSDSLYKTTLMRPNCWSFDLSSVASSGYCSAENSTESEYPPFDWESVCDRLEQLENLHVTVHAEDDKQYSMNDCFFTIQMHSDSDVNTTNYSKYLNTLEAYVEGPSGYRYEVSQSPGSSSSTVICTFRPLECGPHKCHVKLFQSHCSDPDPLVMQIDRKYGVSKPITTVDIEIPETNTDKLEMRKPWGICSNRKTEQIFVADRELHEILVYGPTGDFEFRFGGLGQAEGKFFRPTALAYDDTHDRILVADKDNHRIQIFTPQGKFLKSFGRKGSYTGQFFFPWGIDVSRDGKYIAVADSRNHRIQLFDKDGKFLRKYSTFERKSAAYKKEFDYPRGVSFDLKGENLFVTDFNLHSLFKLPLDLSSCKKILTSDHLRRPQGIAVNDAGNILLCDSKNNSIKVISESGKILQEFYQLGKVAPMEVPLDIEVMAGGYIALLDLNGWFTILLRGDISMFVDFRVLTKRTVLHLDEQTNCDVTNGILLHGTRIGPLPSYIGEGKTCGKSKVQLETDDSKEDKTLSVFSTKEETTI
ncbi:unnamed protein product [Allacma fusca]|uniref:Uncharacterized protein n=1 Tax=Allacma fusca TaxID=39272 RepID=A0A8J2LTN3_9HEXA|nr:unnamed protein product [Allacma fusca]